MLGGNNVKKRIVMVCLCLMIIIAVEFYFRLFTTEEYFGNEAYDEFLQIDDSMNIFAVKGYMSARIFVIDNNGNVATFNTKGNYECFDNNDNISFDIYRDTENVFQCREWKLSPSEQIILKSRLKAINIVDRKLMSMYYGGVSSCYLKKDGMEFFIGNLQCVFKESQDGMNYADSFSNLIKNLTIMEINRYDKPMVNDEAWKSVRPIGGPDGINLNQYYWKD